jgi:macrodomain Ter protein organizer (MatP/YcbG family)
MAEQKQFKSISIEQATYEKLLRLAQQHYRSVPKEIAYLVDEAWEHEQEQEQCEETALPAQQ